MKVYPNKGQVQAQKVMIGYLHKVYIHTLSNTWFFFLESIIKECKCGRLVKNFFLLENWKSTTTFFSQLAKKVHNPSFFTIFFHFHQEKKRHLHFFLHSFVQNHTQAQFSIHTIIFILIIHFFSAILTATGNFLSLSKTYLILQKFPL